MTIYDLDGLSGGLNSKTLNSGDYPASTLYIVQVCSIFLWGFLCWYFNSLYPPGSSDGKRWFFLFQTSFWCIVIRYI